MIEALITHLTAQTENFTTIDHAWDTEPVDDVRGLMPALYLFPGDEMTQQDGTDYLTSKMVHSDVHVYIVCKHTDLEARKTELRTAALGWSAGAAYTDLALVSARMVSLKGGLAWWEDVYRNAVTIREQY